MKKRCAECQKTSNKYCKTCQNRIAYNWRRKNPDSVKMSRMNWRIKNLSNNISFEKITIEKYKLLIEKYKNICGICHKEETYISKKTGKARPLCVDHCHKTGKIRGLLCSRCNHVLGHFKEDIKLFKMAITYLKINK